MFISTVVLIKIGLDHIQRMIKGCSNRRAFKK